VCAKKTRFDARTAGKPEILLIFRFFFGVISVEPDRSSVNLAATARDRHVIERARQGGRDANQHCRATG
jgi:hypothetical protein